MKKSDNKKKSLLGEFDPRTPPPKVASVSEGLHRPKWSVMIPTFNCASYLRQTLESVLSQDPGPEQMQIEVVDDCSTKDDPEAIVKEIGKGRVDFYRNQRNEGIPRNFNTCIERSRGHLIHILHGDDWVLPEFYVTIGRKTDKHNDCAFFATRSFVTDENGIYDYITDRLKNHEEEPSSCATDFVCKTPVYFPGVVIRRSFYEEHGVFIPSLVHVADSEMWTRAVSLGRGIVLPQILSAYRLFDGNDTSKLKKKAENLQDGERLIAILEANKIPMSVQMQQWNLCKIAMKQELHFQVLGDVEGATANHEFWSSRVGMRYKLNKIIEKTLSFIKL